MQLARASIVAGDQVLLLPVNPYTASWGYQENTQSQDTLGGRVVQLLSVQVTDLSITSVAGSRKELQRVAEGIRRIMGYHVGSLRAATLTVPSRAWSFRVYLTAMPQMGWDVAATSYPYQLQMAVEEDLTGVKQRQILTTSLTRLYEGIGYNPAFHGGNAKEFNKVVQSVLKAAGPLGSVVASRGTAGGSTSGTQGQWQGLGLWNSNISNAPWTGNTLQDQIRNCWSAAFGTRTGNDSLCIARAESGFNPSANNSYVSSGTRHYVYGLFQISDVHSTATWFPRSGVHGTEGGLLYDPEYNTRSAMQIFSSAHWGPWTTAAGCGL